MEALTCRNKTIYLLLALADGSIRCRNLGKQTDSSGDSLFGKLLFEIPPLTSTLKNGNPLKCFTIVTHSHSPGFFATSHGGGGEGGKGKIAFWSIPSEKEDDLVYCEATTEMQQQQYSPPVAFTEVGGLTRYLQQGAHGSPSHIPIDGRVVPPPPGATTEVGGLTRYMQQGAHRDVTASSLSSSLFGGMDL